MGSALLSKDALFDVVELLTEDDFYSEIHKEIFRSIKELYRKSSPVDTLTVSEEIKRRNSLEMVGGRAYIAALAADVPSTSNAAEYAKIVSQKASLRRLIETADDIVQKAMKKTWKPTRFWTLRKKNLKLRKRGRRAILHI
ncbi:MAG: DnaB-like helicase N-terminal domain-containing protein [Christensenellales bacterium]